MATRSRQSWKLDAQGQYARQIGWKRNGKGSRVQHKFRLGSDLNEARRREQRLRELWEHIEAQTEAEPLWDEMGLEVARQIAKGATQIELVPQADESDHEYARRIQLAERQFPTLRFKLSDPAKYAAGTDQKTYSLKDMLVWRSSPQDDYEKMLARWDETPLGIVDDEKPWFAENTNASPVSSTGTLHQAMQEYVTWIEKHYFRPDLGRITNTASTKIKQMQTLMERHGDMSLSEVDFEAIEQMIRYWRRRPQKKGSEQKVSKVSAENYIGEFKRFFKWLHRSKKFSWQKPEDFEGIETKVDADSTETRRRLAQASVFPLADLVLLNQFATPLDRIFLLLGLNCGFGLAEIASLTIEDVCLFQGHSPQDQELLHYETTDRDSFIKRVRGKSGVYGEFLLFEQTVQGLQWAMERRRKQSPLDPASPLFLNGQGERYDKPTKNGHRNQQVPNQFARLQKRIRKAGHEVSSLSFGKLRKTAGDLIRRLSDGEVAGVFLCHGQPVQSDDLSDVYTNRPFGKVFAAIRRAEEHLQSVFEAAGPEPFATSAD